MFIALWETYLLIEACINLVTAEPIGSHNHRFFGLEFHLLLVLLSHHYNISTKPVQIISAFHFVQIGLGQLQARQFFDLVIQ